MHRKPSPAAMRAALAIINRDNPAVRLSANSPAVRQIAEIIERETSLSTLMETTKTLIEKADDMIAAIDGTTGQFEPEVAALSTATSAAEKVLNEVKEAKHGKSR